MGRLLQAAIRIMATSPGGRASSTAVLVHLGTRRLGTSALHAAKMRIAVLLGRRDVLPSLFDRDFRHGVVLTVQREEVAAMKQDGSGKQRIVGIRAMTGIPLAI
jgi:hypothetical protein